MKKCFFPLISVSMFLVVSCTSDIHVHVADNVWHYDETTDVDHHWHECTSKDGYKMDITEHTFDQQVATDEYLALPATCTEPAKYYYSCVCGMAGTTTFNSGSALDHLFSEDWSSDETNHWHDCERIGCDAKGSVAAHTMVKGFDDDNHWDVCSVCEYIDETSITAHTFENVVDEKFKAEEPTCVHGTGYFKSCTCGAVSDDIFYDTDTVPHEMSELWSFDEEGHWHDCLNPDCDHIEDYADHTLVTTFDDDDHWQECDACDYLTEKVAHNFNVFVEYVVEPTCTQPGTATFKCEGCDKTTIKDVEPIGHEPDTSTFLCDEEYHWNPCLHEGCEEQLNKEVHDGEGYSDVVNTTDSTAGSFRINCSKCECIHTHTYGEPVITFSEDLQTATATYTCEVCKEDAPDHTYTQTVNTVASKTERGRITPPATRYTATFNFLGDEYSDYRDVAGEPYDWQIGSSGADTGEMYINSETGNMVLDAVLTSGDTTFMLTEAAVARDNKVGATMVQITFKILSFNDNTGLWYTNQIDGYSGKDANQLTVGSVVTIFAKVGTPIIFRNGLKVEVESVYYLDPYLVFNENSTKTGYYGVYNSTRNEDGLITSFNFAEDGANDFCEKVGFSAAYMGMLSTAGYESMSFDISVQNAAIIRAINHAGGVKKESYPGNNTRVTIDIDGANPFYIDACGDGGVVAAGILSITNIVYYTAFDSLANKVISSQSQFEYYIHHDYWGEYAPTEQPFGASKYGEYVVIKGCADIQANKLFTEAQQLGARYMIFEADVAAGQGETDVPVQIVAIHGGGAFETPLNTIIENGHVSIKIDLKNYLFDIDGDFKLGLCFRIARNDKVYEGAAAGFKDSADAMNNAWFKVYAPTFLTE